MNRVSTIARYQFIIIILVGSTMLGCGSTDPIFMYGGERKPSKEVAVILYEGIKPLENFNTPLLDTIDGQKGPIVNDKIDGKIPWDLKYINGEFRILKQAGIDIGNNYYNNKKNAAFYVEILPGEHTLKAGCYGPTGDFRRKSFLSRMEAKFKAAASDRFRLACSKKGDITEFQKFNPSTETWDAVVDGVQSIRISDPLESSESE